MLKTAKPAKEKESTDSPASQASQVPLAPKSSVQPAHTARSPRGMFKISHSQAVSRLILGLMNSVFDGVIRAEQSNPGGSTESGSAKLAMALDLALEAIANSLKHEAAQSFPGQKFVLTVAGKQAVESVISATVKFLNGVEVETEK